MGGGGRGEERDLLLLSHLEEVGQQTLNNIPSSGFQQAPPEKLPRWEELPSGRSESVAERLLLRCGWGGNHNWAPWYWMPAFAYLLSPSSLSGAKVTWRAAQEEKLQQKMSLRPSLVNEGEENRSARKHSFLTPGR